MNKDYYKTLGIEKNANKDDIKKAFRKLAHEHHPDKNRGNAASEQKFKEASEAYSVLSDDSKRAQYDRFGSVGPGSGGGSGSGGASGFGGQGGNPFGAGFEGFDFSQFTGGFGGQGGQNVEFDLGDIFGDIFGGGSRGGSGSGNGSGRGGRATRGHDLSIDIEIPFKDAVFGTDREITISKKVLCEHCKGVGGEPGSEMKTCHTCAGKGKVQQTRRSIFGNMNTVETCDTCVGKGKVSSQKCKVCRGEGVHDKQETIEVAIPAGMNDGERLRMTGGGEVPAGSSESTAHSRAGDLYIRVHVIPHPLFQKEGGHLYTTLTIKLSRALLGGEQTLTTLDGDISLNIPAGIVHGETLRVRGKGVPTGSAASRAGKSRSAGARGDLLVKVLIDFPKHLSRSAKKAVEELEKEGI